MALKVGMKQNGQWYSQAAPSTDWDECKASCERYMQSNVGVTELEIFDDNLYGNKGKWTFLTYRGGRWSNFNYPPKKSADAW